MTRGTNFASRAGMRAIRLVACVAIALVAASCGNPMLERKYINEGAGVDLYSGDAANQIALMNQYIAFICAQMGQGPETCNVGSPTFVSAGMNDIDQRCDGYLTWLDARRRDQTPVLAEISAIQGATHDIMAITGSSVKSLNIVTTAFALASATYANWNSRLLVSVNQSTIQEVVYTSQGKYRDKIKNFAVPDQPTAIYLLRNYLRLCMPITIEASINTSTTLVQRDAPLQSMQPLVVQSMAPSRAAPPPPTQVIRSTQPISVTPPLKQFIGNASGPIEATISVAQGKALQSTLCVAATGDFGPAGSNDPMRSALREFRTAYLFGTDLPTPVPDTISTSVVRDQLFTTMRKFPSCSAAGFQNAYEVGIFSKQGFQQIRTEVATALKTKTQQPVPPGLAAGGNVVDPVLRGALSTLRQTFGSGPPNLDPAFYNWIASAGDRN